MAGSMALIQNSEVAAKDLDELISIARVLRPQGIRGEVIAEILTDFPDRFDEIDEVEIAWDNQIIGLLKLTRFRFHKNRVLLKFAGYDEPDKAEELRGVSLVIRRDELAELGADEYYLFDLEGCKVITIDDRMLGYVVKVDDYGAAPVLTVKGDEREYLIPLTHGICPEVDTESKKIVVNPPDGLLDL